MPWNVNITTMVNWNSSRPYNITTGRSYYNDGVINERPLDPLTGTMIPRNTGVGAGLFNINMNVQKTVKLKRGEQSPAGTRAGNNGTPGVNNFAEPQRGGLPGGGFPGGPGGQRGPRGDGGLGGQRGGPGGNRGPNGGFNQQTGPTMTFRAQFQNLLNNVQYGNYIGTMTSPFFGHAISTARPARQIELGLRFNF